MHCPFYQVIKLLSLSLYLFFFVLQYCSCPVLNLYRVSIIYSYLSHSAPFNLSNLAIIFDSEQPQIRTHGSRGMAVMASGILVNTEEKVTCPMCLELLTEPLILDCRQSFCQACITANKRSKVNEEGESSCPVYQSHYQPANLWPNWYVANIVETLREGKLSSEEEQKRNLSEHMERNSCSSVRRMGSSFAGFVRGLKITEITTLSS